MNTTKRPDFLSALCVLTFTGSSIAFVGYFLVSVFFEQSAEIIIKYSSWSSVDRISPLFFTALMTLYAFSLTGAIRMWKQHRDGFFLYSFAQLVILFLPVIWINSQAFSITNTVFTGIFILGYAMHWKWLHKNL